MKQIQFGIGIFIILIIFSCNTVTDQKTTENLDPVIKEAVVQWNDCLNKKDLKKMSILYADSVMFYGSKIEKAKVIDNKEKFFTKYPDFTQSITGDIVVQKTENEYYKVSFPKRSVYNGKTQIVEGRLIFKKMKEGLKITSESDEESDKRILEADGEYGSCLDVVLKIVTTSPIYMQKTKGLEEAVIKNGGTGFGLSLESSPEPDSEDAFEFSETYDFNLHESYPDRINVISRFSFNPGEKVLYEYDVENDAYKPIAFDKSLLSQLDRSCR